MCHWGYQNMICFPGMEVLHHCVEWTLQRTIDEKINLKEGLEYQNDKSARAGEDKSFCLTMFDCCIVVLGFLKEQN